MTMPKIIIRMVSLRSLDDRDTNKEGLVNNDRYSINSNMSFTSLVNSAEYDQLIAKYNSQG